MKRIKVCFTDFWPSFDYQENYFTNILSKRYDVLLTAENPDLLFYSVFGTEHFKYNCKKVFFSGENIRPDFDECDFSLTFDHDTYEGRNFRLPLYALYGGIEKILNKRNPEDILRTKTGFCNFLYSNARGKERNSFYKKLSKYRKVDSAGYLFNNMGYKVKDKLEFLSGYKFTIAFENESYPGYTSEKIFQPMQAESIPIYWGNPLVSLDFNTKSFINYYDYSNEDELIEKIIQIDSNDDLYLEMLAQPWFADSKINKYLNQDYIADVISKIVETEIIIPDFRLKNFKNGKVNKIFLIWKKTNFLLTKLIYKVKRFSFRQIKIKISKKLES